MQTWCAGIDIDAVFNHCKPKIYTSSYLSKQENECSHGMAEALTESIEKNFDKKLHMKNVAHAHAAKIEHSEQEAVYQVMPEFWIRKIFPGDICGNSNIPEKRVTMMSNQKGINNLPDESTEIFKKNMLDHYHIRLVNCTHAVLFITCLMLSFYSIIDYHLRIIT